MVSIIKNLVGRYTKGITNKRCYIIVHDTASGNATFNALVRFFRLSSVVSCHYLVGRAGEIIKMVEEDKVAWHAGVSEWLGDKDLNRMSIGIEVLSDGQTYTEEQRKTVWHLCREIMCRNGMTPSRVLRHSDVARPIGRKSDITKPFWLPFGPHWANFQSSLSLRKYPLEK